MGQTTSMKFCTLSRVALVSPAGTTGLHQASQHHSHLSLPQGATVPMHRSLSCTNAIFGACKILLPHLSQASLFLPKDCSFIVL